MLPLHNTGVTLHPPLLPHAAAAPSSSQWVPPRLYHLARDPHHVSQVPHSVLGVRFQLKAPHIAWGLLQHPPRGCSGRQDGVKGFKSAGRCKSCCSYTQAALGSSSWHVPWQKIRLGKAMFGMGTSRQHSHARGALRLPSCQYQRKQEAGLFSLKIKPCPVLPASICTAH